MAGNDRHDLRLLPDEMLRFVLESSHNIHGPRLGQLLSHGRLPIHTPHYISSTSRGVVPHLSQDVFQKHTDINATYMALEDFIEKSCRDAPIFKTPTKPGGSTLRKFTALPAQCLSVLGPRRIPRVQTASQNTDSSIAICTSVGFRTLELSDYVASTSTLRPDISVVLPDLPAADKLSKRRIEKSADRTQAWLRYTLSQDQPPTPPVFASIPPLEAEQQRLYLSALSAEYLESLSGLCIYEPVTALTVPPQLTQLPVLCISDPLTPHGLLRAIALGVDLITVPLVTAASEQGIAFTFTFPPPAAVSSVDGVSPSQTTKQPLGMDLFSPIQATSLAPLASSSTITNNSSDKRPAKTQQPCQCYTCTTHHRAYVHHLLSAREMLAWTLLQTHNFHVLSTFFAAVRNSIRDGTFDEDRKAFEEYYSEDWGIEHGIDTEDGVPADINDAVGQTDGAGESRNIKDPKERGPRLRGYQMKSLGKGEDKKREKVWGRFDNKDNSSPKSSSRGTDTGTPAELSTNIENNQAAQVLEAKDSKVASKDLELTASDFETLGVAEREADAKE